MAAGAPICTYLNKMHLLRQYQEVLPVLNCRSRRDIVNQLDFLLREPDGLERLGQVGRDWIYTFYSKRSTVATQMRAFQTFLSARENGIAAV
jgi:hypothetical protein